MLKLSNQNKRNAQRKFLRMAKLVAAGKLPEEKLQKSYGAYKNHISHGNCYRLGQAMDQRINSVLQGQHYEEGGKNMRYNCGCPEQEEHPCMNPNEGELDCRDCCYGKEEEE